MRASGSSRISRTASMRRWAEPSLQPISRVKKSNKEVTPFGTIEYWQKVLKLLKESITSYDSVTSTTIGSKFDKNFKVSAKGADITEDIARAEAKIRDLTYRSFDEELNYKNVNEASY